MLKEKYITTANASHTSFEFVSEGPKGDIPKLVTYECLGGNTYNLTFGDWNEKQNYLDDLRKTNNGDRDKVLATVAFTALTFMKHHPDAEIFLKGSSSSRTRLYQMGIVLNLQEISSSFIILGSIEKVWQKFEQGKNYESFLIKCN